MRKYQPIWLQLKKAKEASLSADPALHRRIVKAVIQEKWRDNAYKYLLVERGKKAVISYVTKDNILTFYLTESITLEDLL